MGVGTRFFSLDMLAPVLFLTQFKKGPFRNALYFDPLQASADFTSLSASPPPFVNYVKMNV